MSFKSFWSSHLRIPEAAKLFVSDTILITSLPHADIILYFAHVLKSRINSRARLDEINIKVLKAKFKIGWKNDPKI